MSVDILVTGGSGFLGSNLIKSLQIKYPTWRVSSLDLIAPTEQQERRLHRFFAVDITSREAVRGVFDHYEPNLIVHCAGIVPARNKRYSTSEKDWLLVKDINYHGTINLVEEAIKAGCLRMVYTSSITVVIDDLDHEYVNIDETVPIGSATLHYGRSKGMAETYVLNKTREEKTGFQACALRPCTIIGEGDRAFIPVFHDLIAKGETCFIVGDGKNLFDFMHIDNAVLAHVLAVENMLGPATANGHAFFVSNQEPVLFWDFLAFVWAQFGHVPARRWHIPVFLAWFIGWFLEWLTYFTGSASTLTRDSVKDAFRSRYCNNAKAIEILGYRPVMSLSDGTRRACEEYKEFLATPRHERDRNMSKKSPF